MTDVPIGQWPGDRYGGRRKMMSHRKQLLSLRLLILLIAVGALFLLLSVRVAASTPQDAMSPPPPESYRVRTGDTLWVIAQSRSGPGDDVRSVVGQIKDLNDLTGSGLRPGQVLLIPTA
jgi:LysM repeat protein